MLDDTNSSQLKPVVGLLYFQENLKSTGELENRSLIFIDTPPSENSKSYDLTWVAQMEDYGNGLEVYTEPTAGGGPIKGREATDEDIKLFIECILSEKNNDPKEKLTNWIDTIKNSEDCETLLKSEKDRLIALIEDGLD